MRSRYPHWDLLHCKTCTRRFLLVINTHYMQSTVSGFYWCKLNISYSCSFTLEAFNWRNWVLGNTENTMYSVSLASLLLSIINNVFLQQINCHFRLLTSDSFKYVWRESKIFWSRCLLRFTLTTNTSPSSCWSNLLIPAIFRWNGAVSSAALCGDLAGCRI